MGAFGSKCSGIPKLCTTCKEVCEEFPGMEVTVHYDENDKKSGEPEFKPIKAKNPLKFENSDNSDLQSKCVYNCKESGGCSVAIKSSKFVSGNTLGSCFSPSFGGKCSGIPEMCQNCLEKCQGKEGEEFSEIVDF